MTHGAIPERRRVLDQRGLPSSAIFRLSKMQSEAAEFVQTKAWAAWRGSSIRTASGFSAMRPARWPAAMHKGFGGADSVFNRTFFGMSRTELVVTMATPSPDSTAASRLFMPSYSPAMVGRCRCSRSHPAVMSRRQLWSFTRMRDGKAEGVQRGSATLAWAVMAITAGWVSRRSALIA